MNDFSLAMSSPIRALVTKIGFDGHDRGSRLVATFLKDAGMEVIYTPPWQSIEAVVKLALALTLTPFLIWGVIGGTLGYSARSVYGYLNTRQKYQLNLTQSLYFQNLDNNYGAIQRLLDEAEEQ